MIIDSHLHLPVIPEARSYERGKEKLLEDLKSDQVNYAILIPDNLPDSVIGDLPTCLELTQDTPQLFLLGTIDIQNQGGEWIAGLERLADQRRIVGLKIFPGHDPIYPTDPRLDPVYAVCQAHDLPMVMHTGWNSGHPEAAQYNDPKYIVQVAERYPSLKIVLAHYFWPEVEYCYQLTHGYANIAFDTSGLADAEVIQATGADKIEAVLLKTLAEKPRNVIFGSDYAMCSRPDHIEMVERLPITDEVREGIFWRNAVEIFKLPNPASA